MLRKDNKGQGMFKCRNCGQELTDEIRFDLGWHCDYPCDTVTHDEDIQPERSKREDLIERIVPPEPDFLTKKSLEEDVKWVKSCCGMNPDLLGCGALNSMET